MKKSEKLLLIAMTSTVILGLTFINLAADHSAMGKVSELGRYLQYEIFDKKAILMENSTRPEGASVSDDFREGEMIIQPFEITEEMLQYKELTVAIQIATLGRKNTGTFIMQVCQGDVVTERQFSMEQLKDNSFLECSVDTDDYVAGGAYLKCFCNEDTLETLRVYFTTDTLFSDHIIVFGKEKKVNLMMRILYPVYNK